MPTNESGPWWSNTWWGRRTGTINVAILGAIVVFLFVLSVWR